MNTFQNAVDRDQFAKLVGIELTELLPGAARAEMTLAESHLNGLGTAHGGAIFTLADLAFAAAANSHGTDAMAINIQISYFKAVREGKLTAVAREISLNRKLATYTVDVLDSEGTLVAAFTGTAYRRS